MSIVFLTPYSRPETVGENLDFAYRYQYIDEATGKLVECEVDQMEAMQSNTYVTPAEYVERGLPVSAVDFDNYLDVSALNGQSLMDLMEYYDTLRSKLTELEPESESEPEPKKEPEPEFKKEVADNA